MNWLIFAFIAAILTAASAITQKRVLLKEHAMEFSATLAIMTMVISAPLFLIIDYARLEFFPMMILFFGSILGAFAFLLIAKSLRHMDVSSASPLLVIGPVFVAFFAFIFLGEKITLMQVGGIFLLVVGSYVLELKRHHNLLEPFRIFKKSKYIHYILFALVLYGLTATIDRTLLGYMGVQPEAYIAFAHIFVAFHFFWMITIFHDGWKGIKNGFRSAGGWLLLVALFTVGYRLAQSIAVSTAKVALVASIKRTAVLFAVIVGGELFHEKNIFRKAVASVIMIGGIFLIVL